jgi:hypothetical protein
MKNKRSVDYINFTVRLNEAVSSFTNGESSRKKVYNGASICGQESCGNSAQDNTTLGCIAGASFAQYYCIQNGMGGCNEMRDATIDQCCSSFCNPQ